MTFESVRDIIPKLHAKREEFLAVFKRATKLRFNDAIARWLEAKHPHITGQTADICAALVESFPEYLERHEIVLDLHVCGSCIDQKFLIAIALNAATCRTIPLAISSLHKHIPAEQLSSAALNQFATETIGSQRNNDVILQHAELFESQPLAAWDALLFKLNTRSSLYDTETIAEHLNAVEAEELTRFGSEAATVELDPLADVKVEVEQEEEGDGVISLPAAVHVTSHAYTNLVFDVRFVIVC